MKYIIVLITMLLLGCSKGEPYTAVCLIKGTDKPVEGFKIMQTDGGLLPIPVSLSHCIPCTKAKTPEAIEVCQGYTTKTTQEQDFK